MVMRRNTLVLFGLLLLLAMCQPPPSYAGCLLSHCKTEQAGKKRTHITNTHRQIVGDLYNPGTGRVQIRDTSRRIVGYIERSGRITNLHRQRIGKINE